MKWPLIRFSTRLLGSINKNHRAYQSLLSIIKNKRDIVVHSRDIVVNLTGTTNTIRIRRAKMSLSSSSSRGAKDSAIKTLIVCKENEMTNGEMKEFDVDGVKVLVVKDQCKFYALGPKCTHYAAPLAKGVYCNGIVRCPWHGACFNVKTGDIEDFPGLDSLPIFETKVDNGHVLVRATEAQFGEKKRILPMCPFKATSGMASPVVIVGGGAAALSCAESLRQHNFSGRILMLSAEKDLPYDRPKLSKALDIDIDQILLRKADFLKQHNIEIMNGTKVTAVDTKTKQVTVEGGKSFPYHNLIVATGGQPRTFTQPGANLGNVFYLRTPQDAKKIADTVVGKNLIVVGASFIGMELAAWAAKKASSVTIVGNTAAPFQHVFGVDIGNAVKKLFETNGIKFKLKCDLVELKGNDKNMVTSVKLSNGETLPADLCIAGIGVEPATQFLKNSGVTLTDRGFVKVNEFLQTSCPDVYACGDISVFPLATFGGQTVNIQHWQMALKHGKVAGQNVCGLKKPVHSVPFFWTVLFGKSLRYTGYSMGYEEIIIHDSLEELKFVAYFLKQNQLVAVATLNKDPVAAQIAEWFRMGKKISKNDITANTQDAWQCKA